MTEKENDQGLVLGISIIAVLVLLVFMPVGEETVQELGKNMYTLITGLTLQYIGLVFVVSYFFPHKSFLFRLVMLFCGSKSPKLNERKIVLTYFLLCFAIGTYFLLVGVGVIAVAG